MKRALWSLLSYPLALLLIPATICLLPELVLRWLGRLARAIARPWRVARLHAQGFATVGPLWTNGPDARRRFRSRKNRRAGK